MLATEYKDTGMRERKEYISHLALTIFCVISLNKNVMHWQVEQQLNMDKFA